LIGSLIAFEGLDGSGKSTQVRMLLRTLRERHIPHERIAFPRTGVGAYGEAIAMFLRGEFGSVDEVNPYLLAALFAGDRAAAKSQIEDQLRAGHLVVADRYSYSNFAFQAAKLHDEKKKEHFLAWARRLEFHTNQLPIPSLTIFFDAPISMVESNLHSRRTKERRDYLRGLPDIHESSISLQELVAVEYRSFSNADPDFIRIEVSGRPPVDIHREVLDVLSHRGILKR